MLPGVELARRRRSSNFSCPRSDRSGRSSSKSVPRERPQSGIPQTSSEIQAAAANALATLHARYRFHPADDSSRKAANEARERLEARLRANAVRRSPQRTIAPAPAASAAKKKKFSSKLQILSSLRKEVEKFDCPICLEGGKECGRAELVLLPCKHGFHKECIEPWIERSDRCPCCRARMT